MAKHKLKIMGIDGKPSSNSFEFDFGNVDIREDIFKKAVLSENSIFRQPYGAAGDAGKKASISVSRRRSRFRSTYGKGQARVPRKTMSRRGMQIRMVGAFSPGTVGGRKAHPPKPMKSFLKDMNNKEWIYALKVGLLASLDKEIVLNSGNIVPNSYPFILDDKIEDITKTKDLTDIFLKLDFSDELNRCSKRTIRAGKGKMRNRRYRVKKGPLLVVSDLDKNITKSIKNVRGFEVMDYRNLLVSDLSMGYTYGRAVVFTKSAAKNFMEEFMK